MARLGFIYDMQSCTGCGACQIACKDRAGIPDGRFFRRVSLMRTADGKALYYSGACNHCGRPACVEGCPTGALYKSYDGTVQHEEGLCIGCGACVWNCPYGAPKLSELRGISGKCDACVELRREGSAPACVRACVTHCLEFGEIGDEELSCAYRPDFLPDPSLTDPSLVVRPRVRDARGAISRLLIVGTGIAGLSAAAAARARDPFIEIELVGEEPHLPYGRPLISKSAFGGAGPRRFPLHPMEWYEKRRIGIKTGARVAGLNAVTGEAVTNRGERIPFDRCIIATGAESFVPPIEGREADGVSVVRDAFSLSRLRQSLPAAHRAVVIGGGVIGIEVAWELYRADREIAVLELAPSLMGRLLDTDSARGLARNMERMGVRVRTGICISGIEHSGGRVTGVRTDDGNLYEADIVVISCGIAPHKELAAEAGCATERGIVVNERMETDVPNIYACGDCAQFDGVNKGLWTEAAAQGSVAGANAAGAASAYGPEDGAVLLNCFGTCLYAIGETAGADGTEVLSFTNRSPRASRFLVNEMHSLGEVTERYVFRDERLAGGVLTGDLSRMETLRACVSVREPRDAFIRKMEES